MELQRASHASPQRTWTAQDPHDLREIPRRHLLRPEEWLPLEPASPRFPWRWPTVYHYIRQWCIDGTSEKINQAIRERLRGRLRRDPSLNKEAGEVMAPAFPTPSLGSDLLLATY